MRANSLAVAFLSLTLLGGPVAAAWHRVPIRSREFRIRVCATAFSATTAPCDGRAAAARVTSRGIDLLAPPGLRGDTLALPGDIEARVSDGGEVVLTGLDSAEYLHAQVFEHGADRAALKATGHHVVVHAPGEGDLWIEAW